jgi:NADH-quinone oxidoreductase subunit G
MLEKPRKAYLLMNVEPDLDCANSLHAIEALKQAKFVVALSLYRNPVLEAHAHVILPMVPFTETSGTFINVAGDWQSFTGMAKNDESSRPAWKILRVLANFLNLQGFDYESSTEVKHEIKALYEKMLPIVVQTTQPPGFSLEHKENLTRIGEIPIYALDSLVRRAEPLQEAQTIMEGETAVIRLHPETARKLGLEDGDVARVIQQAGKLQLPVLLDNRVAIDAAWIAGGIEETVGLGDLIGKVEIQKV